MAGRAYFRCRCGATTLYVEPGEPVSGECPTCGPMFAVPWTAPESCSHPVASEADGLWACVACGQPLNAEEVGGIALLPDQDA